MLALQVHRPSQRGLAETILYGIGERIDLSLLLAFGLFEKANLS